MTRTTAAYSYHLNSSGLYELHFCGPDLNRPVSILDKNGVAISGWLGELQHIEKWQHSRNLGGLTAVAATVHATKSVSPDRRTLMQGVVGNGTDTKHGFKRAVTLTAAPWWITGLSKPGNKNFIYIEDETIANAWAYFNVATGAMTSKGVGFDSADILFGQWYGNSFYFACKITGTAAAHTIGVYAANADGDNDFPGDSSTTNVYFDLVNVVQSDYPPAPMWSVGSDLTKTADSAIQYAGGPNLGGESFKQGSRVVRVCMPTCTPSAQIPVWTISDGGSASDKIEGIIHTDGTFRLVSAATAGSAGLSTVTGSICTREVKDLMAVWKEGHLQAAVRDVATGLIAYGTVDNSVNIPDELDRDEIKPTGGITGALRHRKYFAHSFRELTI